MAQRLLRRYRGVALVPRSGRWRTTFKHKSHRYCLGTFSTAEEAARVWDLAAIKSRAPDFTGLNFPRETYAMEMDLLDKHSLEQTLHMLKVKLIDAKRSGRAVKRKLDSALAQERQGDAAGAAGADAAAGTEATPRHALPASPSRKGSLSAAGPLDKPEPGNPFSRPAALAVKRCPRPATGVTGVEIARRPTPACPLEQRFGSAPSALHFLQDPHGGLLASPPAVAPPLLPTASAPIHLLPPLSRSSPHNELYLPFRSGGGAAVAPSRRFAAPAVARSQEAPLMRARSQCTERSDSGLCSSTALESPRSRAQQAAPSAAPHAQGAAQSKLPGCSSPRSAPLPRTHALEPFRDQLYPRPATATDAAEAGAPPFSYGEAAFLQRSLSERATRSSDAAGHLEARPDALAPLPWAVSDDEGSELLLGAASGPWDSWAHDALLRDGSDTDAQLQPSAQTATPPPPPPTAYAAPSGSSSAFVAGAGTDTAQTGAHSGATTSNGRACSGTTLKKVLTRCMVAASLIVRGFAPCWALPLDRSRAPACSEVRPSAGRHVQRSSAQHGRHGVAAPGGARRLPLRTPGHASHHL